MNLLYSHSILVLIFNVMPFNVFFHIVLGGWGGSLIIFLLNQEELLCKSEFDYSDSENEKRTIVQCPGHPFSVFLELCSSPYPVHGAGSEHVTAQKQ